MIAHNVYLQYLKIEIDVMTIEHHDIMYYELKIENSCEYNYAGLNKISSF